MFGITIILNVKRTIFAKLFMEIVRWFFVVINTGEKKVILLSVTLVNNEIYSYLYKEIFGES